jgi:23S rRNA G2445 N2-methylase RlmL
VLVRVARFHASTFYELERRAKKIEWYEFLLATGSVTVRVTCRKSRLYHSDAVAERARRDRQSGARRCEAGSRQRRRASRKRRRGGELSPQLSW